MFYIQGLLAGILSAIMVSLISSFFNWSSYRSRVRALVVALEDRVGLTCEDQLIKQSYRSFLFYYLNKAQVTNRISVYEMMSKRVRTKAEQLELDRKQKAALAAHRQKVASLDDIISTLKVDLKESKSAESEYSIKSCLEVIQEKRNELIAAEYEYHSTTISTDDFESKSDEIYLQGKSLVS